jgi:uncharacterized phage protein (TIGR01671 family)
MNRERKFRAWNPDDNKMEYPLVFAIGTDGILKPLITCADGNRAYKDYPIMEFTGMNDYNGKEIFEGDIIRTNRNLVVVFFGTKSYDVVFLGKKDTIEVTGWLVKNTHGQVEVLDSSFILGEVIGNTYENQELVKQFVA